MARSVPARKVANSGDRATRRTLADPMAVTTRPRIRAPSTMAPMVSTWRRKYSVVARAAARGWGTAAEGAPPGPAGSAEGQSAVSMVSNSPASQKPEGDSSRNSSPQIRDAPVIFLDRDPIRGKMARPEGSSRGDPAMADGNITKDAMYEAVSPDDFESLLNLDRYGARSTAFDKIISATHDHFWDPLDKKYIDFDEPFDLENVAMVPDHHVMALRVPYASDHLDKRRAPEA